MRKSNLQQKLKTVIEMQVKRYKTEGEHLAAAPHAHTETKQ
jgi:hypothetical protein